MRKPVKIAKPTKERIMKEIKQVVEKLGEGRVEAVAYDTAWVSRVPKIDNLTEPQFPESLEWLRKNQCEDGTWGTQTPFNAHGNVLSTLAAILAFKHWNLSIDQEIIQKAVQGLNQLALRLKDETYETIGFELLVPKMMLEAQEYQDLKIDPEPFRVYDKSYQEKMKLIKAYQAKVGKDRPDSWWFSAEAFGSLIDQSSPLPLNPEIAFNIGRRSIAGSPAATAFILAKSRQLGKDYPIAFEYLDEMVKVHQGGAPNVYPVNEFESSFCTTYLYEAGVPVSLLETPLSKVLNFWENKKGKGLGYSSDFDVDSDDTSHGALLLNKLFDREIDMSIFTPFFKNDKMFTYETERVASFSVNCNSLVFLKEIMSKDSKANEMALKIADYLEEKVCKQVNQPPFQDKWHFSPYYPTSRSVFALIGLKDEVVNYCLNWFIQNQREDGGWGYHDVSTIEETGHVCLALCYAYNKGYSVPINTFVKAQSYYSNQDNFKNYEKLTLWIGKSLYCPTNVVKTLKVASEFSLMKVLQSIHFKKVQQTLPEQSIVSYKGSQFQHESFKGVVNMIASFLCPVETYSNPNSANLNNHTRQWALSMKICDPNHKLIKGSGHLVKAISLSYKTDDEDSLNIINDFSLLNLVIDDIMDDEWKGIDREDIVTAFRTFSSIFTQNLDKVIVTAPSYPKFQEICNCLIDLRNRMVQKSSHLEGFIASWDDSLEALLEEYDYRIRNREPTLKEYLEAKYHLCLFEVSYELGLVLRRIQLTESERANSDYLQLKRHATKSIVLMADLVSLPKELMQGDTRNFVLIKQKLNRFTMQEAFDYTAKAYNNQVAKMVDYNNILKQKQGHNNLTLLRATSLLIDIVQGNTDWSLQTPRYQNSNVKVERQSTSPRKRALEI